MSQRIGTFLSFLRPRLLALAITAIAGGCGSKGQADAQPETHAKAVPTISESEHDGTEHAVADHATHAAAATVLPAPPVTAWPSDAPLREGMRRMHQSVTALAHAEHEHLDATQTRAVAQQVQDAANDMFANCKLPPEPDAALHGLLATLLGGAAAIKANPADLSPVASMREAVALYPRMFEDATWQADTAAAQ